MAFGNYSYNPYAWSNPYAAPQYSPQYSPQGQSAPPTPPTPPQPNNGIRWVQGEAGMKAYPLAPGESAFLMDSENPMAYLKTMDQSGMPSTRYFSITEINPETITKESAPKIDYATQDDLLKVRDDISKLRKALKSLQASMEVETNE